MPPRAACAATPGRRPVPAGRHSDSRISPVGETRTSRILPSAGLLAADLVGMELALAVEILPGLFEVDAGDRLPGGGAEGIGHLVEGDGLLADPRGQVAVIAAASHQDEGARPTTRENRDRRRGLRPAEGTWRAARPAVDSIIIGDDLPPGTGAQGLVDLDSPSRSAGSGRGRRSRGSTSRGRGG